MIIVSSNPTGRSTLIFAFNHNYNKIILTKEKPNKKIEMIKKLEFNIDFYFAAHEFKRTSYYLAVADIQNDNYLYDFNFNSPCYIQLINSKGKSCAYDTLCLKKPFEINDYVKIYQSYEKLYQYFIENKTDFSWKKDFFMALYVSKNLESHIDLVDCAKRLTVSMHELEKMHRDINWFNVNNKKS